MSGERQLRSIHELMPIAIAKVGAVGKRGHNEHQNFKFRTIDDVYSAVHSALAQSSISVGHEFEIVSDDPAGQKTRKGDMRRVIVRLTSKFYGQDGSCIESTAYGEGTDSGDKAVSKAHTMAVKTLLISTFCIPLEGNVDPDSISVDPVADVEQQREVPIFDRLQQRISGAPNMRALSAARTAIDSASQLTTEQRETLLAAGAARVAALQQSREGAK